MVNKLFTGKESPSLPLLAPGEQRCSHHPRPSVQLSQVLKSHVQMSFAGCHHHRAVAGVPARHHAPGGTGTSGVCSSCSHPQSLVIATTLCVIPWLSLSPPMLRCPQIGRDEGRGAPAVPPRASRSRASAVISVPVPRSKSRRDRAHGVSPVLAFQHLPITEQVTSPPRSPSPAGEWEWGARGGGSQLLPAPRRVLGLGLRARGGNGAEHHACRHIAPAPRSTVCARRRCCPSAGIIYLPETPQFKC